MPAVAIRRNTYGRGNGGIYDGKMRIDPELVGAVEGLEDREVLALARVFRRWVDQVEGGSGGGLGVGFVGRRLLLEQSRGLHVLFEGGESSFYQDFNDLGHRAAIHFGEGLKALYQMLRQSSSNGFLAHRC